MRVFPFVWIVVTMVLGAAVLTTTWLDAATQMSWFDDHPFAYPGGLADWPDPILAAIGIVLLIGGFFATFSVVDRTRPPIGNQAGGRQPARGWPRVWILISIGLGVLVIVMPILQNIALDDFYNQHGIADGANFGASVILVGLGMILIAGGIVAGLTAYRYPRAGSLVIASLPA